MAVLVLIPNETTAFWMFFHDDCRSAWLSLSTYIVVRWLADMSRRAATCRVREVALAMWLVVGLEITPIADYTGGERYRWAVPAGAKERY